MKNIAAIAVLMISMAALSQTTDTCREVLDSETICTFSDGSATMVFHPEGTFESTHYAAAQWAKSGPAIESAARAAVEAHDNAAHALSEQLLKDSQARLAKAEAALAQQTTAFNASLITNKKKCLASGFAWSRGTCSLKDGQ